MMQFYQPNDLNELFTFLREHEQAVLLAGGTDVSPMMHTGRLRPAQLVDLSRVRELAPAITVDVDGAVLSASVTMTQIAAHPAVQERFAALSQAARSLGSRQVRNIATLGGNLCTASPAGDTLPALLVYEAQVVLASAAGERVLPIADFLLGPRRTARDKEEVVLRVVLPDPGPHVSCFEKLSRRRAVDLAIVNAAAQMTADGGCRISVGASGPVPFRAQEAEAVIRGHLPDEADCRRAGELAKEQAAPIDDNRASAAYRKDMVASLVFRTLSRCAAAYAERRL